MTLLTRAKLLLLCLVPALVVPRGVVLDWCLCPDELSSCCNSCCGEVEPSSPGQEGCASCKSIELEDFDELLTQGAPVLPALQPVSALPETLVRLPRALALRPAAARPPPSVLRAGAAPLLL